MILLYNFFKKKINKFNKEDLYDNMRRQRLSSYIYIYDFDPLGNLAQETTTLWCPIWQPVFHAL